jgi:T5orf172 domain
MTFVYLIHCSNYPFRIKIGYSNHPATRARSLNRFILGRRRVIFALPYFGHVLVERKLHRLFKFAHKPIPNTNGGTEFYSIFVAPLIVLAMLTLISFQIFILLCLYILMNWLNTLIAFDQMF